MVSRCLMLLDHEHPGGHAPDGELLMALDARGLYLGGVEGRDELVQRLRRALRVDA
jgi:hypothetical protein